MRKIKKYWPIVVVACLGLVVNIGVYYYRNYIRVRVLSKGEVRTILEQNLDKKLLVLPAEYAGFAWKDKKYVFVVFQYTDIPDLPASLCFEVVGSAAVNYDLNGKMPEAYSYGCKQHKITLENITGDDIPEFVYYTDCCEGSGGYCYEDWYVIDIAAKMIVSGDFGGGSGLYSQDKISLSENAEQHPRIREYLLSRIALSQQQKQSKPKSTQQVLKDYWYKHNGLKCSQLFDVCEVKLLWLDYADHFCDQSIFSEDSNNKYKAISAFKDSIYLLDKDSNKIALIYMPDNFTIGYNVKLLKDWVVFKQGQYIGRYDIKTHTLAWMSPKPSITPIIDSPGPKQPYEVLWEHWYKNNAAELSYRGVCKLNLLWLDYHGLPYFFGKDTEVSYNEDLNSIMVMSLYKDGVYLVDKVKKKITLILIPDSDSCQIEIYEPDTKPTVVLSCGKQIIAYDIKNQILRHIR